MHMRYLLVLFFLFTPVALATPTVAVSIKPLHSLVSGVMEGVARPSLIVPEGASSHTFQLTPSGQRALRDAQLIFWIGPLYEYFLVRPLSALPKPVTTVALIHSPGLVLLPSRTGDAWEEGDGHHHSHGPHEEDGIDPHVWLDPENATSLVLAIATTLSLHDPAHAHIYGKNAENLKNRLKDLDKSLTTLLLRVRGRPFMVFHDGLQYFEKRYGLANLGALVTDPDMPLSVKRREWIRATVADKQVMCVFREPEFKAEWLNTLLEELSVRQAQIDSLAAFQNRGVDAYFNMMGNLGRTIHTCLTP